MACKICDEAFMDSSNGCLNPCARNMSKASRSSGRVDRVPCRITEAFCDSDDREDCATLQDSMTTKCQIRNCTQCQQLCTNQKTSFESMRNEETLTHCDDTSTLYQQQVCDRCVSCTSTSATCLHCISCNTEPLSHEINTNDINCEMCKEQNYECELCESSPIFKSYNSLMDNPPSHIRPLHKSSPQCHGGGSSFSKPVCCLSVSNPPQCCGTMLSNFPTQPTCYPYTGPIITIYSNETRLHTD